MELGAFFGGLGLVGLGSAAVVSGGSAGSAAVVVVVVVACDSAAVVAVVVEARLSVEWPAPAGIAETSPACLGDAIVEEAGEVEPEAVEEHESVDKLLGR